LYKGIQFNLASPVFSIAAYSFCTVQLHKGIQFNSVSLIFSIAACSSFTVQSHNSLTSYILYSLSLWASVTLSADNFLNKLCQEFCKQCKEAEDSYKESCDKMWSQLSLELFNDADQFKEVQQEQGEFLTLLSFLMCIWFESWHTSIRRLSTANWWKEESHLWCIWLHWHWIWAMIQWKTWTDHCEVLNKVCWVIQLWFSENTAVKVSSVNQDADNSVKFIRVEKSLINEDKSLHKVNNSSDNYFSLSLVLWDWSLTILQLTGYHHDKTQGDCLS
jgi:hypothetical protein